MSFNYKFDPLLDEKSQLMLLSSMGDELSIVNDARQSFDKQSLSFEEKDKKLLKYLIEHNHSSPFRGIVTKWYVKAPLFVARQWWKHVVASSYVEEQISWNEKSLRYCLIDNPEFYIPSNFRKQSTNNRQASDGVIELESNLTAITAYNNSLMLAVNTYNTLISLGVAKEQARGILPTCLYTSFVWTCSFQALMNFLKLRDSADSQSEIACYAASIKTVMRQKFPILMSLF